MDLEIGQHEPFQQREWRLERVGWTIIAVLIIAGLAGLLGPGPFSWATSRSDAGLVTVEYQRVTHHEADDAITLTFPAEAVQDGMVTVEVTGSWVAGVDLQGISPEPSDQMAVPEGRALTIPVEQAGDTEVHLTFQAQGYGTLSAEMAVGDDSASFTQLVLP